MLKYGDANPLNVHGLRELGWCPPHFEQVRFENHVTEKVISSWIYENLSGRFYIGPVDDGSKRQLLIGFEHASEASFFSLSLPQINIIDF